ncbi:MAG: SpoIIE family protein phosphatase [Chthoniobacteraceae bacterium]
MSPASTSQEIDLRSLVGHSMSIDVKTTLEEVHRIFSLNDGLQFLPAVSEGEVVGLCARRTVGVVLGSRYGFSLFSRKPVRSYLLPEALFIAEDDSLPEIFRNVFLRSDETFDDDVLLIAPNGALIGTIFVRTLVRLQHEMLLANILQVEERKQEIELRNTQMEQDLKMAAEVQLAMLPQQYPRFPTADASELNTLQFSHRYVPSGLVSGDFFSVMRLADGSAGVFICDVMGHGVRSALIVSMLRALVEELRPQSLDPALLFERLNHGMRMILRQHDEPMFASAIYLVVDESRGAFRCAVAGHPLPVHFSCETGEIGVLPMPRRECGPVLGLFDRTVYPVWEGVLAPGDRLLLFTDGLYEASAEDDEFGLDRLLETVRESGDLPTERLLDWALDSVRTFVNGAAFDDDVCLLMVEAAPRSAYLSDGVETPVVALEEPTRTDAASAAS